MEKKPKIKRCVYAIMVFFVIPIVTLIFNVFTDESYLIYKNLLFDDYYG